MNEFYVKEIYKNVILLIRIRNTRYKVGNDRKYYQIGNYLKKKSN